MLHHLAAMVLTVACHRMLLQISGFLKAVREQLVNEFRELRHVSVDNLIYVKEDIIIPHHYSFYDLIASKVGCGGRL